MFHLQRKSASADIVIVKASSTIQNRQKAAGEASITPCFSLRSAFLAKSGANSLFSSIELQVLSIKRRYIGSDKILSNQRYTSISVSTDTCASFFFNTFCGRYRSRGSEESQPIAKFGTILEAMIASREIGRVLLAIKVISTIATYIKISAFSSFL